MLVEVNWAGQDHGQQKETLSYSAELARLGMMYCDETSDELQVIADTTCEVRGKDM